MALEMGGVNDRGEGCMHGVPDPLCLIERVYLLMAMVIISGGYSTLDVIGNLPGFVVPAPWSGADVR
jgi:hypothetical protein